ncbi:hypothetical protein [Bacillus sp. HMF5848]|nr:hypothetical protein [Bacillus sp. HMF5848]
MSNRIIESGLPGHRTFAVAIRRPDVRQGINIQMEFDLDKAQIQ